MGFNAGGKVAIVGVGRTKITRKGDRAIGALAVEASLKAIEDAGLTLRDIDGLSTFPESTGPGVGPTPGVSAAGLQWMVQGLGIEQVNWWSNGGGNISTAIGTAVHAINSGACNTVLVWRAMYQPRSGAFGSGTRNSPVDASAAAPKATAGNAYQAPYGMGDAPTGFASGYMRYMKMYGARREHMAEYALSLRANANKNPVAAFYNQPMSFEDYMNCRMIADPLCLYDCDMPVDGAAAIVLTRADRAVGMKQKPAYINAFANAPATQLFHVDSARGAWVVQDPPNDGVLGTIAETGTGAREIRGLDILTDAKDDYIAYALSRTATLIEVSVAKGTATARGTIGDGRTRLIDLAFVPVR